MKKTELGNCRLCGMYTLLKYDACLGCKAQGKGKLLPTPVIMQRDPAEVEVAKARLRTVDELVEKKHKFTLKEQIAVAELMGIVYDFENQLLEKKK